MSSNLAENTDFSLPVVPGGGCTPPPLLSCPRQGDFSKPNYAKRHFHSVYTLLKSCDQTHQASKISNIGSEENCMVVENNLQRISALRNLRAADSCYSKILFLSPRDFSESSPNLRGVINSKSDYSAERPHKGGIDAAPRCIEGV
ncbi:hypothetical protein JTE90_019260 [Oedothorax gibbosus]|uniref:Uncharacterized protein n=1 Tax=Oedothorax gibbosus TaxID=931172 RepID=A0AAV6URE8_9ARAC|nr:hypothetical protein JTE90_019260 [Oedothorax gibbosus]